MKIKLDENLGNRGAEIPRAAGYSVRTLAIGLADSDVAGKLWIVQRGRIREYHQEQNDA